MRKTARVIAQPCRYDRKQRQKVKYLAMDFRIKQAELWRDDITDLVSVTEQKMDNVRLPQITESGRGPSAAATAERQQTGRVQIFKNVSRRNPLLTAVTFFLRLAFLTCPGGYAPVLQMRLS